MKKLLFTVLVAVMSAFAAQAQGLTYNPYGFSDIYASSTPFFDNVSYKGAFGTGSGSNWAAGWSSFTPQTNVYPGDAGATARTVVNFSGDISGNVTWDGNKLYVVSGTVHVLNGAKLTIGAGCVVRGSLTNRFVLLVSRGGQIDAQGTSSNPIVFTSNAAPGNRVRGDWGGIVMCGRAAVNKWSGKPSAGGVYQGVASYEALPNDPLAQYGGGVNFNDHDNSGIMKFCRIEYAGYVYIPNQEINGITFAGVGDATQVNYVQVSYSLDDSFEWFGGKSNHKYLIAFAGTDDDFDTDQGYRGMWQYFLGVRNPAIYEVPGGTSNGFEHDNNTGYTGASTSGESAVGWQQPLPVTTVLASNVTIVGPVRNGETRNDLATTVFGRAMETRTAVRTSVFNSVLAGYPETHRWNNNSTVTADTSYSKLITYSTPLVKVTNNILNTVTIPDVTGTQGSGNNGASGVTSSTMVTTTTNNNSLVARNQIQFTSGFFTGDQQGALSQFNFGSCDWTLAASSTATSGGSFNDSFFTGKVLSANQSTVSITTSATTVCANQSVVLTSLVTGGTAASYQWSKNGTAITGATTSTYTASSITSGDSYTVSIVNTNGVSSTSNAVVITIASNIAQSVQVLSQSAPTGSAATLGQVSNPFGACSGATLSFNALPTNGGSTPGYQWILNDGTTTRVVDNDVSYLASGLANGSYTLTLKMRSSLSCAAINATDSASATYYFSLGVTTPSVFLRSSLTNQTLGARQNLAGGVARDYPSDKKNRIERYCGNQAVLVNFTALLNNAGSNPSFQWKKNGVNVGTNSSTYADNTLNGDVITCTITSECGTIVSSNAITVVRIVPPATATILGTSTLTPALGSPATINATSAAVTQYVPQSGGTTFFDSAAYISNNNYTSLSTTARSYAGSIGTVTYVCNGPNNYNTSNTTGVFALGNLTAQMVGTYTITTTHTYVTNSAMMNANDIVNSANTNVTAVCQQSNLVTVNVGSASDLVVSTNRTVGGTSYGVITVNNGGTLTLNGNVTASGLVVNAGGNVVTGSYTITLSDLFTTADGATLTIGKTTGLSGAVTGATTTTLNAGTNYVFNGTAAQSTGLTGVSTAKSVTINNAAGVTLGSSLSVSDFVRLQTGNFATGSSLLTLTSTSTKTAYVDDFSTGNTGTMSGTFNFQRFTSTTNPLGSNRHIASPLNGALRSTLGSCASQSEFSELNNAWTKAAGNCGSSVLANGSSIIAFGSGDVTYQFTGTNSTGTKSLQLFRTNLASTASIQRGFNALGNPFPSTIDWTLVQNIDGNSDNSNLTAWIFKNGQYYTITKTGITTGGISSMIAAGQGFLLRRSTTANSAFLVLDKTVRVATTSTSFVRESSKNAQLARFTVSSPATEISDEIVVMGSASATEGEDEMDAAKVISPETTAPSFYTVATDETHSIEALPTITEKGCIVPVEVKATVNGTYTINNTELNNLPAGMNVMIEDRATGKVKDMTEGFSFPMSAGTTKRFNIHFTMGNGSSEMSKLVDIYTANGAINVAFATADVANAQVLVLDATGKTIATTSANGNTLVTIPVNAANGIYVVKVAGAAGSTSAKVFINR